MSYSLVSGCYNCEKKADCTDLPKLQEAVSKIHENCCNEGGHLGSGNIILQCNRLKALS